MRKQKLCGFKVMETASDEAQSPWHHSLCPFQDTLLLAYLFRPLLAQILWFLWSGLEAQGFLCSHKCNLFFCLQFQDLFFTFQNCRPSGCHVPSHILFYVHWVLVTFTQVQTVPFLFPFSLLLIKSYVQTKEPESSLGQWNTLICFYV